MQRNIWLESKEESFINFDEFFFSLLSAMKILKKVKEI